MNLYFYTLFDSHNKYPRCAGILYNNKYKFFDLFRFNTKKLYKDIKDDIYNIKTILLQANDNGHDIITSNFKQIVKAFNFPIDDREYNVYDIHLDHIDPTSTQAKDSDLIKRLLLKMQDVKHKQYQKLLANSAIIYQDLENKGVLVNTRPFHPNWSLNTYSGRSSSTGFNIQGFSEHEHVGSSSSNEHSVLIHFDWISADIRVAALLSKDDNLTNSFSQSDPYSYMMSKLNTAEDGLSREECKLFLLKSINSMNTSAELRDIYPRLCEWIDSCDIATNSPDGKLHTLLDRAYKVSRAKNRLAVLNGAMQGTVAHAMHNVIRKIWLKYSEYLVAEIHDSVILSVPNDTQAIKAIINSVAPIMMTPFSGIIPDNPIFPIRVSIGKKWKCWKLYKQYNSLEDI